jgi:class 3 adenylate cyclase/predicted ATPase
MNATDENLAKPAPTLGPRPEGERVNGANAAPAVRHVASAQTAERRQLTLMFCDLVDSVGLSGRLDPEELSEVVNAYHAACLPPVTRYGGHVAKYFGDGILVFFGFPQAHEDDAARAVWTGLELIASMAKLNETLGRSHGVTLNVRIGIATGVVVVGDVTGEGVTDINAVAGGAVNLAARLQTLALPNTMVVSALTRQLAAERFEYRDLGAQSIKGFENPIPLFEVVGELSVSRFEATTARGLAPFVGRDEELQRVMQCWEHAIGGRGQVVLIAGEAGIGKSRLLREFRRTLEDERHFHLQLQCSPYYQNSALHPVIERLEAWLQLKNVSDSREKLEKLRGALIELGPTSGDHLACMTLLLGIPLDGQTLALEPEKMRRLTAETLIMVFQREARGRPMLIVVEDAHWSDPSTLELLGLMIERLQRTATVIVVTFRPEFRPPWRTGAHIAFLPLARLASSYSKELIAKLAEDTALPETVRDEILARGDGVPLFIEELARSVIASGTPQGAPEPGAARHARQFTIPSTLQESLIARLDQHGSGKRVAQVAALLGRSFSYDLLAAVSEEDDVTLQPALADLVSSGLFIQRGTPPGSTYEFKHVLVQDAAYQLLLKRTRLEHHGRIAEVLERRFPERTRLEPEILAHHWTEGQQALKAATYWLLAGKRAGERSAIREAINHFQKGLELIGDIADPEEARRLELEMQLLRAAALMTTAGPGALDVKAAYARALVLCEELPQSPLHFTAVWGSWRIAMDFHTGRERADRLLELARTIGDTELTLQAHHCQWATLFMLGEQAACCEQIEHGLALYDAKAHFSPTAVYGGHDAKACALGEAGLTYYLRGYSERALRYCEEAVAWARSLDHSGSLAHALDYAVMLGRYRRDGHAILRHAEDMIRFAEQQGLADHGVKGRFFRGYALAQFGHVEWGLSEMRESMEIELRIGTQEDFPVYFEMLAEVAALAGQYDESLRALDQVQPIVDQRGIRYWSAELHRRRGEILLARGGGRAEAEVQFRQALAIGREQDAKLLELRALCSLVRLGGPGAQPLAEALRAIVSGFPEPLETRDLADARALL